MIAKYGCVTLRSIKWQFSDFHSLSLSWHVQQVFIFEENIQFLIIIGLAPSYHQVPYPYTVSMYQMSRTAVWDEVDNVQGN